MTDAEVLPRGCSAKYRPYRYALALTTQFYFCGVPFRLDTSPKCTLNCSYCFARASGGRNTNLDLVADWRAIERKLEAALGPPGARLDVNSEMLRRRVPSHFGGISDPFSNRWTSNVSKALLELLCRYEYPVVISTKNTSALLRDDVLELLQRMKYLAVQVSVTTTDEEVAAQIEPGAPPTRERIDAIRILSMEGIHAIARLQPLFPPLIDEVVNELVPELGLAGCKHVVVEFLKIPTGRGLKAFEDVFRAIGWDGYSYYRDKGAKAVAREWLLPAEFKWDCLQPVIAAIHQAGMTYGAGDYGLNHLGDTACCCGISVLNGFSNWFKGNFANIIRNAKTSRLGYASTRDHWFPQGSIKMYMNSHCRLGSRNWVTDYLRDKWNRPGSPNAPDSLLGVSWEGDYDSDGNAVYRLEVVV